MIAPKNRFRDSKGDNYAEWEHVCLGDVTSPLNERCKGIDLPVYSVNNKEGFIPQGEQFEEREVASVDRSAYKIVRHNQFAYNPSRINVGSIAYLKEDIKVIVSPLYVVFQCDEERILPEFLEAFVKTDAFKKARQRNTVGSVRDSLNYEGFAEIEIELPSIPEQLRIVECLRCVDDIITFSEAQVEALTTQKKAAVKRIFTKEVRFTRPDGSAFPEWQEVRFGDLFTEVSRKTSDTQRYPLFSLTIEDGVTPKTERYERSYLVKKEEDNYKIVPPKAFVYNPMNLRFGALAPSHESIEVCVSQYYNVFSLKDDTLLGFWETYLVCDDMLKYYFSIATGSLIEKLRVHYSNFVNIIKPVPCEEEQRVIAEFFACFDDAILLAKKESELWRQTKKALLQKMFV